MNPKIYLSVIFIILSLPLYSQTDNCEFGIEAQKHIDKGNEILEIQSRYNYSSKDDLLNAAGEFEQALKYNPKCEGIRQTLADIYFRVGKMTMVYMDGSHNYKYCVEVRKHVNDYFSKATSNLKEILNCSYDSDAKTEANQTLYDINSVVYQFNTAAYNQIESLKYAKEVKKNTQSNISLGVDYSSIFGQTGQIGLNVSIVTHPVSGICLTGGVGYPADYFFNDNNEVPLLWKAGAGYSFGSYNWNGQLLALFGKIQSKPIFFETTGGVTLALNIKLISDITLNTNVGYWLSDTSEIAATFGFSLGLCYRFRF